MNKVFSALGVFMLMMNTPLARAAETGSSAGSQPAAGGVNMVAFWILVVIAVFLLIALVVLSDTIKNLARNHDLFKNEKMNDGVKTVLLLIGSSLIPLSGFGQASGGSEPWLVVDDTAFWIMVSVDTVLLLIVIYLLSLLRNLIKRLHTGVADLKEGEKVEGVRPSKLKKVMKSLTDSTPVEKEEEILLAHEHDGIQELDNNLPPWWKWLFYVSIIFSVVYLFHYHVLGTGDLQEEEYRKSVERAEARIAAYLEKKKMNVDENNVTMVKDESRIAKGKEVFQKNCVSCHGKEGGGGIGPNLTDKYWLHGGSIKDVFSTIKYGVPSQGMQAWEGKLSPVQIQNVASFVQTLQGKDPPNAKEPEGELYDPEGTSSVDTTSSSSSGKGDTTVTNSDGAEDTLSSE